MAVATILIARYSFCPKGAGKAPKGGTYKDVPKNGGENHHMSANSVTPYSKGEGPSLNMEKGDHRQTASWGSSKEAQQYRAQQKTLIDQGKFNKAQ